MNDIDLNNISYWFGPLRDSGVRVPETIILRSEIDLSPLPPFGSRPGGIADFIEEFGQAIASLPGPPYFIRTGHTSFASRWGSTCFLDQIDDLERHIYAFVVNSMKAGLPIGTWAAREFLRSRPRFWDGAPVNRAHRFHFCDGDITCYHPCKHPSEVEFPSRERWEELLRCLHDTPRNHVVHLEKMTRRVAAMPEFANREWAVEWLKIADGDWIAIDMKLSSFVSHWPDCVVRGLEHIHDS
jgi:hypothetical protein